MKRLLLPCACLLFAACSDNGSNGGGSAADYDALAEKALASAGGNAENLRSVLDSVPAGQKEGAAFLIAYMPESDLKTLDKQLLSENIEYAYRARETFPWAKDIPEDIFLNDVLPYAVMDETRENWRKPFFELFGKRVEGCKDIHEAVKAVNGNINIDTGVEYNTLREKTNQSPAESMRQHMASCTGLAILLVDAFRSVGIPARFAGIASWHDGRGNHSWVEVWIDGKWYITEYYMPRKLDYPWFLANTGKAKADDRNYAVYATSFKPTGDYFPMVWNKTSKFIHAVNESTRYIDAYAAMADKAKADGTHVAFSLRMFKDKDHTSHSGDRLAVNVDVFEGDLQMDGGRTSGPHQDMNDVLTFFLEKNRTYTFRYQDSQGDTREVVTKVEDRPVMVDMFME